MITTNFINDELFVSFAGVEVTVFIDDAIYPNAQRIKELFRDMNFSDAAKQLQNTIRAKQLIWQLQETLKTRLNLLGSRDPDYPLLEGEYKNIIHTNAFLFYGIQYLQGEFNDFFSSFDNPIYGMN